MANFPELWAGMKVNPRKVRDNGLEELFNISRFQKIKQSEADSLEATYSHGRDVGCRSPQDCPPQPHPTDD